MELNLEAIEDAVCDLSEPFNYENRRTVLLTHVAQQQAQTTAREIFKRLEETCPDCFVCLIDLKAEYGVE